MSNQIKFIYTPHFSRRFRGVYSVKITIYVKIQFIKITNIYNTRQITNIYNTKKKIIIIIKHKKKSASIQHYRRN